MHYAKEYANYAHTLFSYAAGKILNCQTWLGRTWIFRNLKSKIMCRICNIVCKIRCKICTYPFYGCSICKIICRISVSWLGCIWLEIWKNFEICRVCKKNMWTNFVYTEYTKRHVQIPSLPFCKNMLSPLCWWMHRRAHFFASGPAKLEKRAMPGRVSGCADHCLIHWQAANRMSRYKCRWYRRPSWGALRFI